MKYEFDYEILSIDNQGLAQIRYNNKELGWVVRFVNLPVDKGSHAVHQEILYKLPRHHFRAVRISKNGEAQALIQSLQNQKGSFEATISDDGFSDTAHNVSQI